MFWVYAEKITGAIFAGVSVGSGIALLIELNHPEMVDGLNLVGGSSRGGEVSRRRIDAPICANCSRPISQKHRTEAGRSISAALTARLSQFHTPTLVINGEFDGSMNSGKETAAGIPGAKHVVIPRMGHACCIEDPDSFDAAAIGFLKEKRLWPATA